MVHSQAFDPSGIGSVTIGSEGQRAARISIGIAWCGQLGGVLFEGRNLSKPDPQYRPPEHERDNHVALRHAGLGKDHPGVSERETLHLGAPVMS